MSTIERGSEVGGYRIESLLRTGSGGALYRAEQPELRRTVALHVPATPRGSESATRFVDDARLLAGLDHPNLLPVYEVGETDDRPFATVRDPPGPSLDEVLKGGPLAPDRAVAVGGQVAAALDALAAAGATPAALTTSSVIMAGVEDEHAYFSPLASIVDAPPDAPFLRRGADQDSDASTAALARLLTTMMTGSDADSAAWDRLPAPLRPVIERGLAPDPVYTSPSVLMQAAREALGPAAVPSRRSRLLRARVLTGSAFLLAAAAAAAIVLTVRNGDEAPSSARRASANAPAARLAATIPLQATPGSLAMSEDTVWVATSEGTLLRVDPRRNEVVGAPIRFMPARESENVTVRTGEGAVWVLDGSGGNLTRIDPRAGRVTGRLRIGGILHGATVAEGSVWISRSPPNVGLRQPGELVRVDAEQFRRIGRPVPIGPAAFDVEVADGVAWTINAGDGTITRVDLLTGATRTVRPSAQPVDAALRQGTLWIPDPLAGTVTPLDARQLRAPNFVIPADHPVSAAATADAVWVLADIGVPGGPARLYRIDPGAGAIAGRPLDVGPNVGWLSTGFGAVWVRSLGTRSLLKIVPTSPPPAARPRPAPEGDPRPLVSGPLAPGRWRARDFSVPFSFSLDDRGWISVAPTGELVELTRFDEPKTTLGVNAPRQLFTESGGLRRLRSADELIEAITSNPNVRVTERERGRIGDASAVRLTLTVRPHGGFPDFCPGPCVPLFPLPEGVTATLESVVNQRLSIASVRGQVIVVLETESLSGHDFTDTGSLLRTLRFERPRD